MATEGLTYTQYLYSIKNPQALQYMLDLETAVNTGEISQLQFAETVEMLTGKKIQPYRAYNGNILGYNLIETSTVNAGSTINSNAPTVARGTIARPISSTVNSGGKAVIQGLRGVGTKALTGAALVGTAAMCVSAGITLGKTIDSVLYNLNPEFWDSNGMSSLNPETWSALTAGDDSLGASLLNVLFGFDDDGNAQAYIDEQAFAYMAQYMNVNGVFPSNESYTPTVIPSSRVYDQNQFINCNTYFPIKYNGADLPPMEIASQSGSVLAMSFMQYVGTNNETYSCFFVSEYPFSVYHPQYGGAISNAIQGTTTIDGITKTYYYEACQFNKRLSVVSSTIYFNSCAPYNTINYSDVYAILFYGTVSGGISGIGNQTGATLPDTSTWSDIPSTLSSLQNQYPDLWNNAIQYPVIQPDGTVKNYTYVPVAMPDLTSRTDTQPTSGSATQTNPEISPSTTPQELIDALTKILTNPMPKTEPELDNPNPPSNPTDTGDGSSPVPITPTGNASSLWKIYHPTQSQIDSFGAWLWSSDFIDQILKIFNDPMQAIIGLHKIYATPIDAGTATIKVGYLDSEVPSAYIEQQYIEIDCGTVNLYEQFGNVFDYSPFTDVQLYLPFIGIVPLNVADVMRSSITIKYGVDVITGACLAMIEINRDMNNAIMYQYSGNCAVQYPISSGSYMGIVASIISVAGGVAATVATGGGVAPIALGAAGAAMNAHTNVQHSGSFSGNAGAMGGKIPYLIISRPQTKVAMNFESMQGYPTNEYVTIGECSGYVKANSVHVINVNATDEELNMINELLYSGIII